MNAVKGILIRIIGFIELIITSIFMLIMSIILLVSMAIKGVTTKQYTKVMNEVMNEVNNSSTTLDELFGFLSQFGLFAKVYTYGAEYWSWGFSMVLGGSQYESIFNRLWYTPLNDKD